MFSKAANLGKRLFEFGVSGALPAIYSLDNNNAADGMGAVCRHEVQNARKGGKGQAALLKLVSNYLRAVWPKSTFFSSSVIGGR